MGQIKQIFCYDEISFLIDNNNDAYGCGNNDKGQLGLGHTNEIDGPTLLKDMKGKVKSIFSSGDMNIALTPDNDLFFWDKNANNKFRPVKIIMKKISIMSVACGGNFSLILSQQGVVFSFGKSNKFGQLGSGNKTARSTPEPINYLIEIGEKISQIACGFKHSVAKGTSGKVYSWGLVKLSN